MRIRRVFPLLLATLVLAPAVPAAAQDPTELVVVEVATVRAVPDTATVAAEISREPAPPPPRAGAWNAASRRS